MQRNRKTPKPVIPETAPAKNTISFPAFELSLNRIEKPIWKKVFYVSFFFMVLTTWFSGYNSSFHQDEMDMNAYGKANLKYYSSFGKDDSYKQLITHEDTVGAVIKTYGGLFDNIVCSINLMFGSKLNNEFIIRHIVCQTLGLLIILICGYLSLLLSAGFLGGTLTMLLLFCTPTFFGLMIFDTKDIPFAFGYALSIYAILVYIKTLPAFKIKPLVLLAAGIAFATGIRIGGVIILFFIGIYLIIYLLKNKDIWKNIAPQKWKHLLGLSLAIAAGLLIAIVNWPYALSSPFVNIPEALQAAARFPQRIPLLFEGKPYYSFSIPWYYVIKWISITVPAGILILLAAGTVYILINYKNNTALLYLFVLLAALFPIGIAIYSKMALYSQWRHLLFIYPLMVVIATLPFAVMAGKIKGKYQIPIVLSLCVILLAHPIYWSIKNHPFQYTYFNEVSGGFAKNFELYETDYWQVGIKEGMDWLYKNEDPGKQNNVIIATNAVPVAKYLVKNIYKDTITQVTYSGLKTLHEVNWKYLLLNVIFFESNDFKTKFPPYGTIHTIKVDGKPVCAIVKRSVRNDFEATEAMNKGNTKLADSLATAYLKEDPNAEKILEISASCQSKMNQWDKCFTTCSKGILLYPENPKLLYCLALSYASRQDYVNTATYLELAINHGFRQKNIYKQMADVSNMLGNKEKAEYYYKLFNEVQ